MGIKFGSLALNDVLNGIGGFKFGGMVQSHDMSMYNVHARGRNSGCQKAYHRIFWLYNIPISMNVYLY